VIAMFPQKTHVVWKIWDYYFNRF